MRGSERLVKLAKVSDPVAAQVYAALLGSAGIPVQAQGESLGPYVMTLGDWAVTSLWIPESAWDDAVEILTAEEPTPGLTLAAPPDPVGVGELPAWILPGTIGVALLLLALWLVAARL